LEFVTFHVALGLDEAVHPNATLRHEEYLSMIDMMFASARLFHPVAKATVLTDMRTNLDGVAKEVNLVRLDIDCNKLMLERTNAQLRHVLNSSFTSPIVILDSDILLNDSLSPIFKNEFDVAVTWRANESMPINGGILMLNNIRPEITKRFFDRFAKVYREKYADKAAWFGDQFALRDCVGMSLANLAEKKMVEVDGCRILLLPCDVYNFSPENQYKEICSDLSGKTVLHFKGERKRLMSPFWKGWLKPRGSYLPWVQFNGWRERRCLRRQSAIEMQALNLSGDK